MIAEDIDGWYDGSNLAGVQLLVNSTLSPKIRLGFGDHLLRFTVIKESHDLFFAYSAQHAGYYGRSSRLIFDAL